MLCRWTLGNFKSFYENEPLVLAPLTLLCGANSSGKSSLLQSMLLIKQTLEHSPIERVIALNGPLVQLGTFSDILNDRAMDNDITDINVGWIINHGTSDQHISGIYLGDYIVEQSCIDFSFDAVGPATERSTLELQPNLKMSRMTARLVDRDQDTHNVSIEINRTTGRGRQLQYDANTLGEDSMIRFRITDVDKESRDSSGPSHVKSFVVGAKVNHFTPSGIIVRFDSNLRLANITAKIIVDLPASRRAPVPQSVVSGQVLEILRAAAQKKLGNPKSLESILKLLDPQHEVMTYELLIHRLREMPFGIRRTLRDGFAGLEKKIAAAIYADLGQKNTISVGRVDAITRATNATDRYFRFLLRYLGPLRADPRPLYPLQALSSPTDVGPKGEQTAAVLHLNAKRKIQTIPSSAFRGDSILVSPEEMTLTASVADWLKYLGVADAFETVEKGKLGHELRIQTAEGAKFQDLTNVGVGVSQVLPIVVTCLLASPGSTIILEQPELHLHPAVQARLADFFIAMILLKKQCIIETHSEHLIERIRYRVVQDPTEAVHQSTKIYFFSKVSGSTAIKEVAVNRFGSIEDWPKDFFDQSQIANEQIVLMALKRHMDETQGKAG